MRRAKPFGVECPACGARKDKFCEFFYSGDMLVVDELRQAYHHQQRIDKAQREL